MKKNKNTPFHIVHNFEKYELEDGTTFWARDEHDSKLYIKKIKELNNG